MRTSLDDGSTQAHAGADRPQAPRSRPDTERSANLSEVCRHLENSEQTFHRWRNRYGGMKVNDMKRLKELEKENQPLKRIVADKELEIDALREAAREWGSSWSGMLSCRVIHQFTRATYGVTRYCVTTYQRPQGGYQEHALETYGTI